MFIFIETKVLLLFCNMLYSKGLASSTFSFCNHFADSDSTRVEEKESEK